MIPEHPAQPPEDRECCDECHDRGEIECWDCNGTGHIQCGSCNGSGADGDGDPCVQCKGAGTFRCDRCDGDGVLHCFDCPTCSTCGGKLADGSHRRCRDAD